MKQLINEMIELLGQSKEALEDCYDVQSYPADGEICQDAIISELDEFLSKYKFIKDYCERSNMTIDKFNERLVALKCNCEDSRCCGWAAISNDPLTIKAHNDCFVTGKVWLANPSASNPHD